MEMSDAIHRGGGPGDRAKPALAEREAHFSAVLSSMANFRFSFLDCSGGSP